MDTIVDTDVPAARTLHLVDLENLLCGSHRDADQDDVRWVVSRYCQGADWHDGDLVVVATNPDLLGRVGHDLPKGWQKVAAWGTDGADRALLARANPDLIAHRFHRLVVGSGDGIFAELAESIRDHGGEVWVVAAQGHVSKQLVHCASRVVLLDNPAANN